MINLLQCNKAILTICKNMNKVNKEKVIDISEYELKINNFLWEIPKLWKIEKEKRIIVQISERVFYLISLGKGRFIPWYFPIKKIK